MAAMSMCPYKNCAFRRLQVVLMCVVFILTTTSCARSGPKVQPTNEVEFTVQLDQATLHEIAEMHGHNSSSPFGVRGHWFTTNISLQVFDGYRHHSRPLFWGENTVRMTLKRDTAYAVALSGASPKWSTINFYMGDITMDQKGDYFYAIDLLAEYKKMVILKGIRSENGVELVSETHNQKQELNGKHSPARREDSPFAKDNDSWKDMNPIKNGFGNTMFVAWFSHQFGDVGRFELRAQVHLFKTITSWTEDKGRLSFADENPRALYLSGGAGYNLVPSAEWGVYPSARVDYVNGAFSSYRHMEYALGMNKVIYLPRNDWTYGTIDLLGTQYMTVGFEVGLDQGLDGVDTEDYFFRFGIGNRW